VVIKNILAKIQKAAVAEKRYYVQDVLLEIKTLLACLDIILTIPIVYIAAVSSVNTFRNIKPVFLVAVRFPIMEKVN